MNYLTSSRSSVYSINTSLAPDPDSVMVFIDESGSGKSTCINYFTNSSFDSQNRFNKMKIHMPNSLFPETNFSAGRPGHTERNVHDKTKSQKYRRNYSK